MQSTTLEQLSVADAEAIVTLLHQPQAVCCRHLSPVKDIKIFLQGTPIVSLYGVL